MNRPEVKILTEGWRIDYNERRPHSAHWWLTPSESAEAWRATNQLQLA